MLDKITEVKTQVNTLISWVNEMTAIVDNPYSNGLNISKVLKDLSGFGSALAQNIENLEKEAKLLDHEEENNFEPDKAE